jgi:hypothetical protein
MGSSINTCCESLKGVKNQTCDFEEDRKDEDLTNIKHSSKPRVIEKKDIDSNLNSVEIRSTRDKDSFIKDEFDVDNIGMSISSTKKDILIKESRNSILSMNFLIIL